MSGPVSEIKGPGRAPFKWVASLADMFQMKLGAAHDHSFHDFRLQCGKSAPFSIQPVKECPVPDQRDLDGLGYPRPHMPCRQCGEEIEIINDGIGRSKCPEIVFFPESVHAILHADARVVLCKRRRGHTDEANPPVGRRSGIACSVEDSAPSDCKDERMAADMVSVGQSPDLLNFEGLILARLSSANDKGSVGKLQQLTVALSVSLYLFEEFGGCIDHI